MAQRFTDRELVSLNTFCSAPINALAVAKLTWALVTNNEGVEAQLSAVTESEPSPAPPLTATIKATTSGVIISVSDGREDYSLRTVASAERLCLSEGWAYTFEEDESEEEEEFEEEEEAFEDMDDDPPQERWWE
jgi:hypothetical protein